VIVFVDFDGVMHRTPIRTNVDLYFEHVELLASWLRKHEDVHVVVSSSWRDQYSLDELRDLLFHRHEDLQARVVGATRDLSRLHTSQERSAECQLWMVENDRNFDAWVAIDDQPERFHLRDRVVTCDPTVGLTQSELDEAWRLLELQRIDEPQRRARGERNGAPLSPSQQHFLDAIRRGKEPEIKVLTDDEEAAVVATIVSARHEMSQIDCDMTTAAAVRKAAWLALPKSQRWSTVFLDIDEVLCVAQPEAASILLTSISAGPELDADLLRTLFVPAATKALGSVHRQMRGCVRYVVSSSWRNHFSQDQIERIFRSTGLAFVADNLHPGSAWRCGQEWAPGRQEEIEWWLEKFGSGEPFVVLDDRGSGGRLSFHKHFPDHVLFGRVFLCEQGVGLTVDHVDDVVAALRRPVWEAT